MIIEPHSAEEPAMEYQAHERPRIELGESTDVNYWTCELTVNERLLRHAITLVGDDEVRVREFLCQSRIELRN